MRRIKIFGLSMTIGEKDFMGFISGDVKSFEMIFRQYYKSLVSFSMRYGLEQMEAEDVVIEVIHHIWEIRAEVKTAAALNTLFFTSVQNRTINVVRNNKNRNRIIETQEWQQEELYDYVAREEMTRLLDEAIKVLPGRCRAVILMLLQGKTTAEIAREMNVSVNTVKTYKMRAIGMLRSRLADYPLILWMIIKKIVYSCHQI